MCATKNKSTRRLERNELRRLIFRWLFTVFVAASRLDNPQGLYHRCVNDTTWDDRCLNDDLYTKTSYLDTMFFVRRYRDSESNAARQKDAQAWYDAAHVHHEVE